MRYIPGKENSTPRQPPSESDSYAAAWSAQRPTARAPYHSEACAAPDDRDGYNSDDERGAAGGVSYQSELEFINALWRKRGWQVIKMREDGACLFRAVAYHVFGDAEMHGNIRRMCLDYMVQNKDHFAGFVTENFEMYIARKRNEREHGNHLEIQAMSELFNRCVEVYHYQDEPLNIFQAHCNTEAPIRLLYHGNHYDAIIDPNRPTFGVGLGFADLRPGEADQTLLAEAEEASVSQAMVDTLCRQSDWETTEADIEAMILEQSRVEYEQMQLAQFRRQG